MVAYLMALVLAHDTFGADIGLAIFAEVLRLFLRVLQAEFVHKGLARVLALD